MKNIIAIIGLILVSNNCYAFPVIEGVNAITSMIGVLLTIIVSIYPKFENNNKKLILFFLILSIVFICLFVNKTIKSNDEILNAIQSRPSVIKNEDKFNIENIEEFERYNKNLEITQNEIYKINNLNILNIDNPNTLDQYPNNINNKDLNNKDLIISSNNSIKAANYSYENYKNKNIKNKIVKIEYWKSNVGNKKIEFNNPFDKNITYVDIRSRQDIIETHTLENAIQWSIGDFYHMSDKQIIEWFSKYKNVAFISFKDIDGNYETLEYRLKDIKGLHYNYVKGGLNYFFNKGYTITPKYLNYNVMLEPLNVMEMYAKDKNIKFICSNNKCLDNLPIEDTYIIEIKNNKKENIINSIKNLNDNFKYITVSDNQETDGNAILIGYWLTKQNKKYIGKLPLYQRFSLEYIKVKILKNKTLNNYRDNYSYINYIDKLVIQINKFFNNENIINLFFYFFTIGFGLRLFFIKYQNKISKNYYIENKNNILKSLIYILIPIFSIYYIIDELIHYYQMFNYNNIEIENNILQIILLFLLTIQVTLMLKINIKSISIIIIFILLYYINVFNLHPLELMFLIGSESFVLITQIYWYIKNNHYENISNSGIYKINIKKKNIIYPEKWLNVIKFLNKENGILIDLSKKYEKYIKNYKFKNKLYIVRSCDINDNENKLAGYYNSIVTEYKNINIEINKIKNLGCSHVWIQEYIKCDYYGVYSTYNKNYNKDLILIGKNNNVTEGYKSIEIDDENIEYKIIKDKMLKVEKHYKSPIIVEFGYHNKVVYIFQIRLSNDFSKVIYPNKIEDYCLAENLIPECSSITGNFHQDVTGDNYKYYNGFLYENKKYVHYYNIITYNHLKNKIYNINIKANSINKEIQDIYELINISKKLYRYTQNYKEDNYIDEIYHYGAKNGNDLEILSERNKDLKLIKTETKRDSLHYLLINIIDKLNFKLNEINKYYNYDLFKVSSIQDFIENNIQEVIYDKHSQLKINDGYIVYGDIYGLVWNINNFNEIKIPEDSRRYILVGKHIGSGWVKHLDKFSGIISQYGSEVSHLGLSAKQLNIPYKISEDLPEHLSEIKKY